MILLLLSASFASYGFYDLETKRPLFLCSSLLFVCFCCIQLIKRMERGNILKRQIQTEEQMVSILARTIAESKRREKLAKDKPFFRCAICLELYNSKKKHVLQCGHAFHMDCARQWFERNPTCPTCRSTSLFAMCCYINSDID